MRKIKSLLNLFNSKKSTNSNEIVPNAFPIRQSQTLHYVFNTKCIFKKLNEIQLVKIEDRIKVGLLNLTNNFTKKSFTFNNIETDINIGAEDGNECLRYRNDEISTISIYVCFDANFDVDALPYALDIKNSIIENISYDYDSMLYVSTNTFKTNSFKNYFWN